MNYNLYVQLIVPSISILAFIISLASLYYTYHQNKRKLEVEMWIDHENEDIIKLCAYNSGYRSISLIKCRFLVNNNIIDIRPGMHDVDMSKYGFNGYLIRPVNIINFPCQLKEGNSEYYALMAEQVATYLTFNGYSGVVKLSGFFKTAQKKTEKSKSTIDFDIDNYYSKLKK